MNDIEDSRPGDAEPNQAGHEKGKGKAVAAALILASLALSLIVFRDALGGVNTWLRQEERALFGGDDKYLRLWELRQSLRLESDGTWEGAAWDLPHDAVTLLDEDEKVIAAHRVLSIDGDMHRQQKKVFNNDGFRVVFFAGVEGSGHHYIESVVKKMQSVGIADINCKPTLAFFPGMTKAANIKAYSEQVRLLKAGLLEAQARADRGGEHGATRTPSLLPINCMKEGTCKGAGFMSFPNFGGQFTMNDPDIPMLAQVCEELGIDLRIVYLHRDPSETISSVHRRFEPMKDIFGTLRRVDSNARILFTMLDQIDPAFVQCLSYSEAMVPTSPQHEAVARHLDPRFSERPNEVKDMFETLAHKSKRAHHKLPPFATASREQMSVEALFEDMYDSFCRGPERASSPSLLSRSVAPPAEVRPALLAADQALVTTTTTTTTETVNAPPRAAAVDDAGLVAQMAAQREEKAELMRRAKEVHDARKRKSPSGGSRKRRDRVSPRKNGRGGG